eukprot:6806297-Ditylum_brightwellii.AAC.1
MNDLLPFQHVVLDIVKHFDLQQGDTVIQLRVWEDNTGALILGYMKPGHFTLRSKHFGVKYHWFCGKLKPNNILLHEVDTAKNKSNILTKGLLAEQYETERHMLMGF